MIEQCLEYLDSTNVMAFTCEDDGENSKFDCDCEAAEKELRRKGYVSEVCEFCKFDPKRDSLPFEWSVYCKYKEKITKKEATEAIEDLFDGSFCQFPDFYDNFGETPFTPNGSSGSDKDDGGDDEDEALSNLKDSVLAILKRSNFVAQSIWGGHHEYDEDGQKVDIKREDYFFFQTKDGKTFLLKFGWSFDVDK